MNAYFARFAATLPLAALLVLAGCGSPTENKPEAEVGDAYEITLPEGAIEALPSDEAAAGTPAAPAATVYALSVEDGYIGFTGSKSLAGASLGKHSGQFMEYDGKVTLAGDDLTAAQIDISFNMAAVTVDNSVLEGVLKGDHFFEVEKFPTARFQSAAIEKTGDGYTVKGNLTLRGTAKSVSFPASITLEGGELKASAEFSIDRKAWGIGEGYNMAEGLIDDAVLIQIEAVGKPAASDGGIVDNFSQPAEGSKPKAE